MNVVQQCIAKMPASGYISAFKFLFNFRINAERIQVRHLGNVLTLVAIQWRQT